MEIRILNGGCSREINAAVMASALIAGYKLTFSNPFVRFEVPDWLDFLRIYWNGAADFSRRFAINSKSTRMHVLVVVDDGRTFQTDVWYSVDHKGVHYVSLH